VQSHTTAAFRALLAAAPPAIQAKAQTAYKIWTQNPAHPSLRYKKVHDTLPIYSVRIDRDWRAVGTLQQGAMVWFWIGPHDEYERLLSHI
jgi:hypothetical protein